MIGVLDEKALDDLFKFYKDQVYKMLGLFEHSDINAHKHAFKIMDELDQLPYRITELRGDYRFKRVLSKLEIIHRELLWLDMGYHETVKNNVFEAINLLSDIREGLR